MSPRVRVALVVAALAACAAVVVAGAAVLSAKELDAPASTCRAGETARGRAAARARARAAGRRRGALAAGRRTPLPRRAARRGQGDLPPRRARSRRSSAPRSPPGRARSTESSSSARSIRAARSSSSTSGWRASGPASARRSTRGGRRATSSRTRPTPCAPAICSIRTSRRGCRSSSRRPRSDRRSTAKPARRQLELLREAAGKSSDSRKGLVDRLYYGVALQRLGTAGVGAPRLFGGGRRVPERRRGARGGRGRPLLEGEPGRGLLAGSARSAADFPRRATVRFHLGLLLLWQGDVAGGQKAAPSSRASPQPGSSACASKLAATWTSSREPGPADRKIGRTAHGAPAAARGTLPQPANEGLRSGVLATTLAAGNWPQGTCCRSGAPDRRGSR